LAVTFALVAFIFSELVPDLPPISHNTLRIVITVWFGVMGFSIFPDIARIVTIYTVSWINSLTNRVSTEVMSQIMRLPHGSHPLSVPYPQHAPLGGVSMNQPLIIDTSAIIDGRILDIAKTGFLFGTMLIADFVLVELQQVADSSDYLKRARGRKGFETITDLKKIKGLRVEIWDKDNPAKGGVDERLVKLAKSLHGKILTTDYNLNQVAQVSGVNVLNINDLSNALKTVAIPGEPLEIKVIHLGKDETQGVGYLADGTMIVVKDGANLLGKDVKVEVTRTIQIPAGRMIFAKLLETKDSKKKSS
jgi:uncharacterized protein YacL